MVESLNSWANGVTAMATVVARWDNESAVVEQASVEARVHYQSGPPKKPTFVVSGVARFVYPCKRGDAIVVGRVQAELV